MYIVTLFFANCEAKTFGNEKSILATGDTLIPFNVVLYSGDESIQKFEIKVYSKAYKYYADNISPYFYFGKQTDSVWTVELDQFKIAKCNQFLSKAKLIPKECPKLSTSIEHYIITFAKDTINIRGECDWDSLDFFSLQRLLFKDKFEQLELKKLNIVNNLNKKLIGKWYFKPLKKELKKDDDFVLTKTNDFNSECSWEFGNQLSFKSSCNKVFNLMYSDKYSWQVNGDIYFEIRGGIITHKDGSMTVGNYGAIFTLEELTDNELKLKFLWEQ